MKPTNNSFLPGLRRITSRISIFNYGANHNTFVVVFHIRQLLTVLDLFSYMTFVSVIALIKVALLLLLSFSIFPGGSKATSGDLIT